jgi:hypothetical protein
VRVTAANVEALGGLLEAMEAHASDLADAVADYLDPPDREAKADARERLEDLSDLEADVLALVALTMGESAAAAARAARR